MKTLLLIFVLLVTTCLYSTIINVPADQPTIQEGIVAATDTDTVLVADGTYYENIDFIGKAITVASNFLIDADTLHITNTIINGSQPIDPDYGSCARFLSGEDTTSVITGFTLTAGTGSYHDVWSYTHGGGIYCQSSSPKIVSNIVTNNSSQYTGGIECCINSSSVILNNIISNNTATLWMAGGIHCWGNSNLHIEGNKITNNHSAYSAGGMWIRESSPTLIGNTISRNSADAQVGGIMVWEGSPVMINNIISNNTAATEGGGLVIVYGGTTTVQNCLIFGNSSGSFVGGIGIEMAEAEITNCVISGNSATAGDGIYLLEDATLDLTNSIIAGNDGEGINFDNSDNVNIQFCDFYDNGTDFAGIVPPTLGVITTVNNNGDPCDEFMNILLDPLFVDPANEDFHLTEFSPCIDAGDPESPLDPDGTIADIGRFFYLTPPSNLYVEENTGLFTWDAPMTDDLTGYYIYLDGVFQDSTTDTEWQFTDLVNGQEYTAGVEAVYDESSSDLVTIDFTYTGTGAGNNLVSVTELKGNYPNPFNPITTINYSLKENSKVSINIYNIKGQKVKTLVNETFESGNHTVIWKGTNDNGKSVSSGIYFYKMKTDNHEETKKMILMK